MNFQTIRATFARNLWRNLALIVVVLEIGAWMMTRQARPVHADPNQRIWLGSPQAVPVRHQGDSKVTSAMRPGTATPVSLVAEDFDQDGIGDLVVGFSTPQGGRLAIHRGNLDAFAPQSQASFEAIGRGDFPEPYLEDANVIASPVIPDFLVAGRFKGLGSNDLLVAAKGGRSLYVLSGDGKGHFAPSQTLDFDGPVTGVGAFTERVYSRVLIGVHSSTGPEVVEYIGSADGLSPLRTVKMPADGTAFDFGKLDGDDLMDAVVVAGSELYLLRGNANAVEEIAPGLKVTSAALGHYTFDRTGRQQIMALGADGNAHLLVHGKFDSTPLTADEVTAKIAARRSHSRPSAQTFVPPLADQGPMAWRELETIPGAATGANPILLHTRISDNGADDAMVLSAGRMGLLSHPDAPQTGPGSAGPGLMISRTESIEDPVAAIAARVNVDGRPGVVYLTRGSLEPQVMMPLPDPTFTVNTTNDTVDANPGDGVCADSAGHCSVRAAIMEANKASGTDTIMIPNNTYTLTIARVLGDYSGDKGSLYILDSVNIVGGGQTTTIIQGGTSIATSVDKVLSVNEDINPLSNASASISGLTIQNGKNKGTTADGEGDYDGGGMEFDTGSAGTASLTLTNVTITNNQTTDGRGAGIALFNFTHALTSGGGSTTFSSCTISNNTLGSSSGDAFEGAGIEATLSPDSPQLYSTFTMSNSNVTGNIATGNDFKGGGINILGPASGTAPTIHSTIISGNQSAAEGGGGIFAAGGFTADQGTAITGNSTTGAGGGIEIDGNGTDAITLSLVTISGNTATGRGGGIEVAGTDGLLTIQFSRILNNTSSSVGNNLDDFANAGSGGVNATDDWWGTNTPSPTINPSTSTCPTTATAPCFQPFLVLRLQAVPQTIKIGGASALTASLNTDSAGTTISNANLTQIAGLTDTINNAVLGSISGATTTLSAGAQATATFTADSTGGLGSAEVEVDNGTAFANESLISAATESGTTVTITTVGAHGFSAGEFVTIAGVGVAGYNGQFFTIASAPSSTTFTYTATSTGLAASSGGTANAGILILQPPSMTMVFSPTTVAENTASTLTFTITNGNVVPINGSFTDTLPTSLVVATTPNVIDNCGGTVTATAGSGTISFANSALPKASCTIQVNVQSAVDGTYTNSTTIDSSNAGNGNTPSATLTVINPPHIAKAFGLGTVVFGQITSLTLTVSSTNTNLTLSGVQFTDALPSGMVVATPNNFSSTCTGTASGAAGSSSVGLSGATLAPGTSCAVSVNVVGTAIATLNNSVSVGSTNGGTGNTASASLIVNKASTTTTVTSNANPSVFGQSVTFTAMVSATAPGSGTPTGIVTFLDGGSSIGTGTASGGIATFTTTALAVGSHTITTTYPGDTNFTGSSGSLTGNPQVVNKAGISVAVTSTVNPSVFGQSVTFSATISVTAPGAGTPSGTVTFLDGGSPIGSGTLSGLTATFTTNALAVGNHTITATYSGDSNFNTNTGSLNTNPQVVNKANTNTALTSNHNPSPSGQAVTFTASITAVLPGAGTPTGTVTFLDGGVSIGTGGLTAGVATFTTSSLAPGNHTITTTYPGDGNFNGSTGSLTGNPEVIGAAPSIAKAFNPASVVMNGSSTLTFTITNPSGNTSAETGVAFTDTLPSGMIVSASPSLTNTCGGTPSASGSLVSLTGGTVPVNSSCQISVSVTGTSTGMLNNVTGNVSSTNGGTGNTASATLTVTSPDTAPVVTSLTSTTANGTYGVSAVIPIIVTFNKAVNVTGTPQIALNSGGTASYTSGSGTTSLTFTYTVAAGQNSSALDATSTTALTLNGGTIVDSLGTGANLTLPAPGSAGSLSANSAIVINTTAPVVVSYNVLWGSETYNVIGSPRNRLPWQITGIQVVFSAPIAMGNINSLSGGVTPTGFSGLGTNTLTWTINPISLGNFATMLAGSGVNALKDGAGNALAGGAGFSQALKILEGDINDDGIVNAQDLVLVNNARSAPYSIFADMNGDGVINLTDVQIVRTLDGNSLP